MQGVDLVAAILKEEGTELLAVYPAQPLIDACAKVGIRPIICRQERVGMAIADGFLPALEEAVEVTRAGQPAVLDCIVKEGYDFSRYQ